MVEEYEHMEELDAAVCLALLRTAEIARLAVVCDRLEVFPINFAVDGGSLLFRTAAGTKLAGVIGADEVVVEADGVEDGGHTAWSVIVRGPATEVTDLVERFETTEVPLFPWHASPKHHIVRISPSELTGRRFHVVDTH